MVQEKKPAEDQGGKEEDAKEQKDNAAAAVPKPYSVRAALQSIVALIERSVKSKETRLQSGRLLRQTAVARRHLGPADLSAFLSGNLPADSPAKSYLLEVVAKLGADAAAPMEDDSGAEAAGGEGGAAAPAPVVPSSLPEVELYSHLLVLVLALDKGAVAEASEVAERAVARLRDFNRRTLDVIASRIYFYYGWAAEQRGDLGSVRPVLMAAHQSAVLRRDAAGQETLLNLLLRSYLADSLYDQAEKFRAQAQKSDTWRLPQQYCRYLFYLGCIRAVQLEYSEARDCLQQAARKAPGSALGFLIAANKWLIVVRLLLGEIPERAEFSAHGMRAALRPYFELTTAVRSGDLATFRAVTEKYASSFSSDRTSNLITRLHHNVIRTGLHRINLAYSRISLKDIAEKLALPSAEDAEFICAKAIRDGGLAARLDRAGGFLASSDVADVYSTAEPQAAFHARIAFCLDIHNEAVKAMRFDPDAHRRKETEEERRERLAAEAELAAALAEEEDDDMI